MWKIKNKEAVSPVIGVILMVAITVVLAAVLYVWVSGFMTTTSGGVYALSTGTFSNSSGTFTASVVSTTPTTGIKWGDITWQLYDVSTATITNTTGTFTGKTELGATITSSDNLKAGGSVSIIPPQGSGEMKVKAIVGGSQVYESASFTV